MLQNQKSVWHEILDGINYIRSQKEIRFIFWTMFILLAAVGAIYVVLIVFIQQTFHSVTKGLGVVSRLSLTLGLFFGEAWAYGKWGKKIAAYKVIFWSLVLGGIMVVLFTCVIQATHDRSVGIRVVFYFWSSGRSGDGRSSTPSSIKFVPWKCQEKFSRPMEFVVYLAFLLSMMVSSFLSQHIDRLWILVSVGGIFMVVGVVGLCSEPMDSVERDLKMTKRTGNIGRVRCWHPGGAVICKPSLKR